MYPMVSVPPVGAWGSGRGGTGSAARAGSASSPHTVMYTRQRMRLHRFLSQPTLSMMSSYQWPWKRVTANFTRCVYSTCTAPTQALSRLLRPQDHAVFRVKQLTESVSEKIPRKSPENSQFF